MKKLTLTLSLIFCLTLSATAQLVDVVTGLTKPTAVWLDGTELYITEREPANKLSIVDLSQPNPTPMDVVTGLDQPTGLTIVQNEMYITEWTKISKLDLTQPNPTPTDVITGLSQPVDPTVIGDFLYICEFSFGRVSKLDLAQPNPTLQTVVSGLSGPNGLALKGDTLYIAESLGNQIVKISLSSPNPIPTLVVAGLSFPKGMNINGNFMYITETQADKITRIDLTEASPTPELVVDGLSLPQRTIFDGLDLIIPEFTAGKISKLPVNEPVFSSLPTVCANAGLTTLGGASPTGGVYSGPGVTDNGDGETFTFDPAAAGGVGTYQITYSTGASMATSSVEVIAGPTVAFTGPGSVNIDAGVQTGLGGGTPSGGIYSGPGVTDDGNGMTYSFDPVAAGAGMHPITYTYTDGNGCSGTASDIVTVEMMALPGEGCADANDLSALFGQAPNEAQTSGLWDNSNYNSTGDPATGWECFDDGSLEHTVWYAFTGDGNTYSIRTVACNATNYIDFGDTQMAVYSGECTDLTAVACNEDEDFANDVYNAYLELPTEAGVQYYLMIDGWDGSDGEFCVEVTNLTPSAISSVAELGLRLSPNPTSGLVELQGAQPETVRVIDALGRLLFVQNGASAQVDLSALPGGVYTLLIGLADGQWGSAKVVKE